MADTVNMVDRTITRSISERKDNAKEAIEKSEPDLKQSWRSPVQRTT